MGEAEVRALRRARAQTMLVASLSEQLRREGPGALPSIRLDGMPRAVGGVPAGLDARIARRDALERILARESKLMRGYERAARKAMDGMKREHYAFSALYYLQGMSIEETARAIDRSERQCLRYKREIEAGEGGGREKAETP